MNRDQANQFIAKHKDAKSFVKPSHLEELSPLLEVHIEAIVARKDEFHDIQGSFNPRKETLDKFAQAAGVSFNTTAETTRKEGDGCYVGSAQAMVMGPDGKMILGPICEYEFDVDVRLEDLKLKGKADWDNKDSNGRPGTREYTPRELATERVQLMKVARMRANTGARNRATLAILGMQTGFKNLFGKNDSDAATRTFLFSRVIVNAKNELVLNRMLDQIAAPTAALYGPAPVPAIAGRVEPDEAELRNVTPPEADPFDDFGVPEDQGSKVDPRVQKLQEELIAWHASEQLPPKGKAAISAALDRGESDIAVLEDLILRAKKACGSAA